MVNKVVGQLAGEARHPPSRLLAAAATSTRDMTNHHFGNIKAIIAGAGGAAHLPGMVASLTTIPVLGVPIESKFMNGLDSLLSIVQMPYGIPTATFAVGEAGAKNAALFAISLLASNEKKISAKLNKWRQGLTKAVNISPK